MEFKDAADQINQMLQYREEWANSLADCNPGIYGVEDFEVDISNKDIFVNFQELTFNFKNANFTFTVKMGSSGKDGVEEKFKKIASGKGTFTCKSNKIISISDIELEFDMNLYD